MQDHKFFSEILEGKKEFTALQGEPETHMGISFPSSFYYPLKSFIYYFKIVFFQVIFLFSSPHTFQGMSAKL
jgi:hypothetical protein